MKKKIFTVVSASFISALMITGCSKKADTPAYTKDQLVGTYVMTALTSGSTNVFDTFDDCEKDNLQILNSDLTYDIVDAGEQCEPSSDESGPWSVSGNKLTLDGQTFTIESLTAHQLIVSGNVPIGTGTASVRATYAKE